MALSAKLQLRQSQSLVMTPQLMQSIRLLQFSHQELERFIEEEVEKNPLLERPEAGGDELGGEPPPQHSAPDEPDPGVDQVLAASEPTASTMAEWLDSSLENVFADDPGASDRLGPQLSAQWPSASAGSGDSFDMDDLGTSAITLADHVSEQIAFAFRNDIDRLIAHALADMLDESGYMRHDTRELALRLGVDVAEVERILTLCQSFDPPGLFARDLADCLAIQLKARNRYDPAMQALVAHLDLLARRDFSQLRRICGVDDDDLLDMLSEIRALDPRPGLAFEGGTADTIAADVVVRQARDGTWTVELDPDTLPRVLLNQSYFATVSRHARTKGDKEFLAECLQSANWLTRSLDQRARTILKVATEIVRQQDAFLMHGIRHLRPLNLRTVADAIGMHESTVSRVTANKYMMTPRGIFELRYFFSVAIASAEGGDAHSSEAVRDRIRELIDNEQPFDVLSDDAIVDILKKSGVDIARRTVAKYREGMSIPSSVQRRREKRAMARLAS